MANGGEGCIEHDIHGAPCVGSLVGERPKHQLLTKGAPLLLILAGSFSVHCFSNDIFCTALGAWFTKEFWSLDGHKSDSFRPQGDTIFLLFQFFSLRTCMLSGSCFLVLHITYSPLCAWSASVNDPLRERVTRGEVRCWGKEQGNFKRRRRCGRSPREERGWTLDE